MKTHSLTLVAVALLGLTAITFAESPEPTFRLDLDLVDGSHIIGIPISASVPVHTPYGKMDIPLNLLRRIKLGDDQETATVFAINGDKITGVMGHRKMRLRTLFGGQVGFAIPNLRLSHFRMSPPLSLLPPS